MWDTVRTNVGAGCASLRLLCADEEDYVDCLRELSMIEPEWHESLRSSRRWKKNDNPCPFSDIGQSIAAQAKLSRMERDAFDLYRAGTLKGSLTVKRVERLIVCERTQLPTVQSLEEKKFT